MYYNLPAIKNFLSNINLLNKKHEINYVMVDLNTQLSYPVAGIINRIFGGISWIKENYKYVGEESCYSFLSLGVNDADLCIRAFNEIGNDDIDTDMRMMFSIVVGYNSGRLILVSPFGPVLWEQSPNIPQNELIPATLYKEHLNGCDEPWISTLYKAKTCSKSHIYQNEWVEAIQQDLKNFILDSNTEDIYSLDIQCELETSTVWQKIMSSMGYPKKMQIQKGLYINPFELNKTSGPKYGIKESIDKLNSVCRDTMFYYLTKEINTEDTIDLKTLKQLANNKYFEKIMNRWVEHLVEYNYFKKTEAGFLLNRRN